VRWLPLPVWSWTTVIRHVAPAQEESCAVASAYPPGLSRPMSLVALSEARLTW
jgi:hypothetical protein